MREIKITKCVTLGFRLLLLQGGRPVSSDLGAGVLQTSLL